MKVFNTPVLIRDTEVSTNSCQKQYGVAEFGTTELKAIQCYSHDASKPPYQSCIFVYLRSVL